MTNKKFKGFVLVDGTKDDFNIDELNDKNDAENNNINEGKPDSNGDDFV